jgi:hypothetical protein
MKLSAERDADLLGLRMSSPIFFPENFQFLDQPLCWVSRHRVHLFTIVRHSSNCLCKSLGATFPFSVSRSQANA